MGIEIRLTEQQLPVSPILVDFLYRHLIQEIRDNRWHQQLGENLSDEAEQILATASARYSEVAQHPLARQTISRSYDLMMSLMFGASERLAAYHCKMRFTLVVGAPRSGGLYLTRHLFGALGRPVGRVPSVIGHDGFPDPVPFAIEDNNAYTTLTRHMAEYMAMAELFFAGDPQHEGKIIAPKKATKTAYYGAFFNQALGKETEIVLTIRHPVASCISTFEKSGGMPEGRYFRIRSNIESWVDRDIAFLTGSGPAESSDYFDSYLQYWENYHYALVLTGSLASPALTITTFNGERIKAVAEGFYQRFGTEPVVDVFRTQQKNPPDVGWKRKGDCAVQRVAVFWEQFGFCFPTEEIMESW